MTSRLFQAFDTLLDKMIFPSYIRLGYAVRSLAWEDADLDVDMAGKVCAVTGASSGLGRVTAEGLAGMGAAVHMLVRDPSKGEAVRAWIESRTGNANIFIKVVDLSSLASVRQVASSFLEAEERLDVLVNNAGAMIPERRLSVDGVELTFATNVLGPFLLTSLLVPRIVESAPARIIHVSSGGMYAQGLDVNDLQFERKPYNGVLAYAQAKRAQVILTEMWADKLAGTGVTVNSMHPGWADTPGVQESLPTFYRILGSSLRSPRQGADTILWLAASPRVAQESGKFWFDRRPRETHKLRRTQSSPADRERLWETCVELSGLATLA